MVLEDNDSVVLVFSTFSIVCEEKAQLSLMAVRDKVIIAAIFSGVKSEGI